MNKQQQAAHAAANTIVDLTGMLEEVLQTQQGLTSECREEIERCLRENYKKGARRNLIQTMGLEEV